MSAEAELLRRAAALVRERARGTSLAPWAQPYEDEEVPGFPVWMLHNGGLGTKEHAVAHTFALSPNQKADADWIALMGPQVAEPFAAWLEGAVEALGDYPGFSEPGGTWFRFATGEDQAPAYRHAAQYVVGALAMARALLGEATS